MEFSSCIARCAEPLIISDDNTMFLDQILVLQDMVHLPRYCPRVSRITV